jgi:signal transduction histidine kinase
MSMSTLLPAHPVAIELAGSACAGGEQGSSMTAADLAELMAAFNEVTARLQGTHESLEREVARLREELRAANEQLQRSRRLAALGEMAAGIAHEVRNPLGSIRLYARMLEQDLRDRPQERQIAGRIAAAVGGLDAIVGDVLSFSRELRVRCEAVDGAELLTRALESCWNLEAAESGIRIVRSSRGEEMHCDPALMHQALVNIIRNAIEAMTETAAPRGGHELRLESAQEGDEGAIRVIDTGPGVSREVIDRMFNPFFTTRASGTGLGLAIVHRIVDAHGGRIVVKDRGEQGKERGTIFELLLPRRCGGERTSHKPGREARRNGVQETRR